MADAEPGGSAEPISSKGSGVRFTKEASAFDIEPVLDDDAMTSDGEVRKGRGHKTRLMRSPVWGAVCNSIAFMAVPRAIPACFKATGWPLGLVCLVYSSIVTYDTGMLIGKVTTLLPAECYTCPSIAAEAGAAFAAQSGRNQKRWRIGCLYTAAGIQYVTYYLTSVSELIYFEKYMGQIFEVSPLCQWQWLLVVSMITLPALQIPGFHGTRLAAVMLGLVPLVLNIGVFTYEIFLVQPWNCRPGPTYSAWPQSMGAATLGLSAFGYAFGGHGMYPEIIREMAEPSRWGEVIRWTYAVVVPLYVYCGILGYAAYGDASMSNINQNAPRNLANQLSIMVQAVQEIFYVLTPNLVVMLALELQLGVDPAACCAPRTPKGLLGRVLGVVPTWVPRLVLRTMILGSQCFVAQALLCGAGDTLFAMISLVGAVGMTAFTYVLPYLFYAALSRETLSRGWKAWAALNVAVGSVVAVTGATSSITQLFGCEGGFFSGDCRLDYAYAPLGDIDPCNLSGSPFYPS